MKKYFRFACVFLVLLAFALPAMSAQEVSPYRNHTGYVGNSTHIWQYGYFDKLVGNGTNATINGFRKVVTAKTASYSVTAADCGKVFSNYGTTSYITFDLPSVTSLSGCEFTFLVASASSMIVAPRGTDYIRGLTNAAGDSISNGGTVGNAITIITDGVNWFSNGTGYGTWSDDN